MNVISPKHQINLKTAGLFGIIRMVGLDAQAFLQSQCSNDSHQVNAHTAQWTTYSTPKGRMLANFVVMQSAWSTPEAPAYLLLCRQDLIEATMKRLRMYVMRSKVVMDEAPYALYGVHLDLTATSPLSVMPLADHVSVLPLSQQHAFVVDERVDHSIPPMTAPAMTPLFWQGLNVVAKLPWIGAPNAEAFVPQMANMDQIGAINFKKGCYPGQEIVARMHYLGQSKRALFRITWDASSSYAVQEACSIYTDDGSVVCGQLVNWGLTEEGAPQALIVNLIEASSRALSFEDGTRLQVLDPAVAPT